MNYQVIKTVLSRKQNGSFTSLVWERQLPVRKAYADNIVTKRSSGVVRCGISYDNMKSVQIKRADGILPAENAGLKWGEWLQYPNFIQHKGNIYLRCAESPNNKIKTEYFLNGRPVEKSEIEGICTKAAFTNHENLDVFTINVENILAIRQGRNPLFLFLQIF